ncbi:hypothetical protein ACFQZW_11540 [Lutibacter aestuarii]|uniref:DUF4468 domain-containing protein n=1 Tax=Lutibacter aestuarii TaxID=861111 RepID=A0ABW2ZC14_9FLAO
MKKAIVILLMLISINNYSQDINDLKEYISEIIDSNDPTGSYDNYAMFDNDVLKIHAEGLIGRSITHLEFKNLFIYGFEFHNSLDKSGVILFSQAEIIDIRGISKVSTTRVSDKNRYYFKISLYIKPNYLKVKYEESRSSGSKNSNIDKLEILISDNEDASVKIKKAFLKLGEILGLKIKDGDYF